MIRWYITTSKNSRSFLSFPSIITHWVCLRRRHLCGYDLNLTYPQGAPFPSLRPNQLPSSSSLFQGAGRTRPRTLTKEAFRSALARTSQSSSSLSKRELAVRAEKREAWKRDLSQRANGTIDPFYQCFLLFELLDYAVNFTTPWCM
jgi:carboxypeptidase D